MISHNSTGWLRLSWLVPLLSLWDFSCTCCQMGLDPRCYSMRLLFPCDNLSSGSSPRGLSLPWTFYMVSLDLQEVELEVFRCPQCLEFASLRMLLLPHSSGQNGPSPRSDSRGRGTSSTSLKGRQRCLGWSFISQTPSGRALLQQPLGDGEICKSQFWKTHWRQVDQPPNRTPYQCSSLVWSPSHLTFLRAAGIFLSSQGLIQANKAHRRLVRSLDYWCIYLRWYIYFSLNKAPEAELFVREFEPRAQGRGIRILEGCLIQGGKTLAIHPSLGAPRHFSDFRFLHSLFQGSCRSCFCTCIFPPAILILLIKVLTIILRQVLIRIEYPIWLERIQTFHSDLQITHLLHPVPASLA